MAIVAGDWTVTRTNGNIRYIGDDHNGAAPSYATVIEFHRWLQGLADDAVSVGDDELDITNTDPSSRSTDNIITLLGNYNIDDGAAEHLYDGSIIQGSGGSEVIYDGITNFGNASVQIQIIQNGAVLADDYWNRSIGGAHDGANDAAVLTDSGESWTTDEWVDYTIYNTTDGSQGVITANTATTITATLFGGTDDDWDTGDTYEIGVPLNPNATQGISHRFMVKVRNAGADIDGRRLLGTCRRFGKTYSEFPINGTSRGNNVLALSDTDDLNNSTVITTVDGWTGITNSNEGYIGIDVDNNGSNEFYYSQWDVNTPTRTINDFYERMKYLSRDSSTSTLYGLNGELFRGITHQINLNTAGTNSGTFSAFEAVSWTGGTGQMLAIEDTTASAADTMWIQLLTGTVPGTGVLITGGGSGATATTAASNAVVSRTVSTPFVGASTGSAIIGGYGLGIETDDLTNNDTLFDLTNTAINPPNNVTYTVGGLVSGEDRVLVAPWDGVSTDANGDPEIDYDQLSLNTTLSAADESSVVVTAGIPSDTPNNGTIRVELDGGAYQIVRYSSWTGSTFTIQADDTFVDGDVTVGTDTINITAHDFKTCDHVQLTNSGGALPTGLATATDYYIIYVDANNIRFADSIENAAAGTQVDITAAAGGGTHTIESMSRNFSSDNATSTNNVFISYIDTLTDATSQSFTGVYSSDRDLVIIVRDGQAASPIKQFITSGVFGSSNATVTAIRTTDL